MGFFGNLIGQGLGKIGSMIAPIDGVDGAKVGGAIGNWMPFAKGGQVPYGDILAMKRGGRVKKHRRRYQKKSKK